MVLFYLRNRQKIRFKFKKNDNGDHCNVYIKNFQMGFAINIINLENSESFVSDVSKTYYNKFNNKSTSFEVMPSEGTIRKNQ